jgi:hypothetical protein
MVRCGTSDAQSETAIIAQTVATVDAPRQEDRVRLIVLLGLLAGCSPGFAPPATPPVLELKQLMAHVIDPAADAFWESSGTIVTAQGERSRAPTTAEGWDAAVHAAATLAEGGTLLMLPGRAREGPQWQAFANELTAAGLAGMRAAQAKDERAVFDTGGRIYDACRSCHVKYIPGFQ